MPDLVFGLTLPTLVWGKKLAGEMKILVVMQKKDPKGQLSWKGIPCFHSIHAVMPSQALIFLIFNVCPPQKMIEEVKLWKALSKTF